MKHLLLVVLILSLTHSPASAATITVRPDGTGDYPTIQAAMDAASDGDVVLLTAGTFTGPGNTEVFFNPPSGGGLTIRSESGAAATTIDATGKTFGIYPSNGGPGAWAQIEGITITGAGDGVKSTAPQLLVKDCVFTGCTNQALYAAGLQITIEDCSVVGNNHGIVVQPDPGGTAWVRRNRAVGNTYNGINTGGSGDCIIEDNFICSNTQSWNGGGLYCASQGAGTVIRYNTICHNATDYNGGGMYVRSNINTTHVHNNTVVHNESRNGGPAVFVDGTAIVETSIIAWTTGGAGLTATSSTTVANCDIYGNDGGDGLGGGTDLGGNVSEDPLFCGIPGSENYFLTTVSGCAPTNHSSGLLVGAWPVGCGTTETHETSWGELKARYR